MLTFLSGALSSQSQAGVSLATFDGASGTTFKFTELNDPVMGGKSTGTWHVDSAAKAGVMDGDVVDVPSLKAPGFIKAAADGTFPDASSALGGDLVLKVRSTTPDYAGFRVSFASGTLAASYACAGGGSIPFSRGCFKSNFSVPAGSDFTEVRVPFASFSDKWSPATGEQTTTCAADKDVCPTAKTLGKIIRLEVWAEGKVGKVHLEVASIVAQPAAREVAAAAALVASIRPPAAFDGCSAAVQPALRYGISGRTQPTVPVPVATNENLAEAVCCDVRAKAFAEPQFLFEAPDISLFSKLPADGTPTTFYDSVCGVPLFKAPVGRSFAEFKADTVEHGWPSFRSEEVITANVVTNATSGDVRSSCGTHLGSYLPDAKGPRWCMDLSCVAGAPKTEVVEA